jgi:hypothetical protein
MEYYIWNIVFYTILYLPSIVEHSIVAMKSKLVEPTLYFYTLYPLFLNNDYGTIFSFKLVLPNISLNMNVLKIIQAHIQSIMFNKKVLQMISSASKSILMLKWYYHKQN